MTKKEIMKELVNILELIQDGEPEALDEAQEVLENLIENVEEYLDI